MVERMTDEDVKAFQASDEYKAFVAGLKHRISSKKLALSPNDVPKVVAPMEPEVQRRLFAKGFAR